MIPVLFQAWFAGRGWAPHAHQAALVEAARSGRSALLTAPTGGGKTLAGFLPSLIELHERPREGLHTLYVSPLKALAVDIQRNLMAPIAEMGLAITAETRTGDTPQSKRLRQRRRPPHLLMTTPESLALLLSYDDAPRMFGKLSAVIVDEVHAIAGTKRGDQLALGLARLSALAPGLRRVGLSATAAHPAALRAWLSPTGRDDAQTVAAIEAPSGIRKAEVEILDLGDALPWGSHMALHALTAIYARIKAGGVTLVFVNTRAQAELVFDGLWRLNDANLPIGLHHGSLAVEQRRKIEAAMARGALRAIVATSSLDLGIDWGAVDLVIQVGAPKGVSRLLQRIGRSNHRFDEPSRALLVPANRFETLECQAALDAIAAHALDGEPPRPGGLDVLAQHLLGAACGQPFHADDMYREVTATQPYADLPRADFDAVLDFVATGGYALRAYERYQRLKRDLDGRWTVAGPAEAKRFRMNIGTIVEQPLLKVRLGRGRVLGEVEEYFVQGLVPGDTFLFAGRLLTYVGMRDLDVEAAPANAKGGQQPKIPAYAGGRLPLTTELAERVLAILADRKRWRALPGAVRHWLDLQIWRSAVPRPGHLLVESFPRERKEYLVAYCFAGRNAHQTLGMMLTRRMERAGLGPLGFVATDYSIAIWSLKAPDERDLPMLFDQDMLGDDLEAWMAESSMIRRSFRNVAVIAGLIERHHPGERKTGRQVTFGSDLIYDVLRRHEPDHVLLRATRRDAATGLTDVGRLGQLLARIKGRIDFRRLERVSPLAVPVLLEIGRVSVDGTAIDTMLDEAVAALIDDATRVAPSDRAPKLPL